MVKTLEALKHLAGQLDGIVRNELETREAIARMDGQLDIIRIQIGRLDPHTATQRHVHTHPRTDQRRSQQPTPGTDHLRPLP